MKMLQQKQAGIAVPTEEKRAEAPRNVINLMDALRRSVDAGKRTPAAKAAPRLPAKAAKAAEEGQEERRGPARNAAADRRQGTRQGREKCAAKPAARRKAG